MDGFLLLASINIFMGLLPPCVGVLQGRNSALPTWGKNGNKIRGDLVCMHYKKKTTGIHNKKNNKFEMLK